MSDIYNRAQIIDEQFSEKVRSGHLPQRITILKPEEVGLNREECIDLFESQVISRHLDLAARVLKQRDLSYYTIGSSGHEGNVVLGKVFRSTDMAFLHYRSGALMAQRSKQVPGEDPIRTNLLGAVAAAQDPIAGGRHKVFGSVRLMVPPQTSTIASHLPKAVGAAFSIGLAKSLGQTGGLPTDSVILCSFGDASANHSTSQGAFNAAQWITYKHLPLPLVFVCEDNGIGISVETPSNWIQRMMEHRVGLHYISANGLDFVDAFRAAKEAETHARHKRKPVFLHLKTVRLMGHAGSDIELKYRSLHWIETNESQDPLLHSAALLIQSGYLTADKVLNCYESIRQKVAACAQEVVSLPKLASAAEVMVSVIPPPSKNPPTIFPTEIQRESVFGKDYKKLYQKGTLAGLLNLGLTDLMIQYPNTLVFGEDVASKGGVYHVTVGLSEKFGLKRVFNSLLDEQTILGHAIGLAHNGFIPIPEIQFLAYLHNAEDQLRGEAATLSFFSNGQYTNPMVIRIAGLAYQKGFGGHFHNDNSFAVLRDIPGILVACPSNGSDAVKLLRTCIAAAHEDQRVVVFLEPIALYPTRDLNQPGDGLWMTDYPALEERIAEGEVSVSGSGISIALVSYANGFYLCRQVEQILKEIYHITPKLIDLHWLAPVPEKHLLEALAGCERVLIVDESRKTGSISEALMALFLEKLSPLPRIQRITGEDSFIPLGTAWEHVLPSKERILEAALELMDTPLKK